MESLRLQKKEKIHYFLNINIIHQLYSDFTSSTCTYSCAYIFSSLQLYYTCRFMWPLFKIQNSSKPSCHPLQSFSSLLTPFCWSPLICFPSPLLRHFKNTILMESCSMHTFEICFFSHSIMRFIQVPIFISLFYC